MIIHDQHVFLSTATEVEGLIKPLKEFFGITSFVYQCNFDDGSEIKLSNQPEWLKHFYIKELYQQSVFEHKPSEYKADVKLWAAMPEHSTVLAEARLFNIDHGVTLINPIANGVEFAFFGTTQKQKWVQEKYLRNLDLLQHFLLYFKEQAQPLLKQALNAKIVIPHKHERAAQTPKLAEPDNIRESFLAATGLKKLSLDQMNTYLTERETACAKILITGATIKEIAYQLGLSPRTVETYVNNMKAKLDCGSLSSLRQTLSKLRNIIR